MANPVLEAKKIGWTIFLGNSKSFSGAIQEYDSANGGKVAVGFNCHEAFIVSDDQGLFGASDLKVGIFEDKEINMEELGHVEGVQLIAWEDEKDGETLGTVSFNESLLTQLGLNDFAVKESLTTRILALSKIDVSYNPFEQQ